jgi:hypothetical protein
MVDGHQSIDVLERLPLHRMLELAAGVQALVTMKNRMMAPTWTPPPDND